ncbi:hypothetical protein [Pseudomonas fragi]|uniref:hypothetical protein n=1 Tax=Pseudomonas fragi TaxID=296 RepID=UPI00147600DE|nr:hypothetical protein [Pseudomonas fragi]NNB28204.1 hypothetical protein [Pseudomonas fragi]
MGKMDNLTREKIREWQIRRLGIKDQMQLHPEKILELTRVLDLMDEEHAAILNGSATAQADVGPSVGLAPVIEHSLCRVADRFDLQLHVTAHSEEDLSKLLEIAVYELQKHISAKGSEVTRDGRRHTAGMSGTLGGYNFELCVNDEGCDE